MRRIHLDITDSTNNYLKANPCDEDIVVTTDFQTAGRGQKGNFWESDSKKNLLFSILVHPTQLKANEQFALSEVIALSIQHALLKYADEISIKWPNDIYWKDKKICGILVENSLMGTTIEQSIIGCGVNVNQESFKSNAPNPVSLLQITEKQVETKELFNEILANFTNLYRRMTEGRLKELHSQYKESLYRKNGFYNYSDENGQFLAEIADIETSGHLVLSLADGTHRRYAFKEVKYII